LAGSAVGGCGGVRVLTRIPLAPKAAAHERGNDASAAEAAVETVIASAKATDAPTPEMLTMAPDPRAIIFGSSAAVRKNGALTLTSNVISNDSTSFSSVGADLGVAALFTST